MSAYTVLSGMYTPIGKQIWDKSIAWQPIPVHTVPVTLDNVSRSFTFVSLQIRFSDQIFFQT